MTTTNAMLIETVELLEDLSRRAADLAGTGGVCSDERS